MDPVTKINLDEVLRTLEPLSVHSPIIRAMFTRINMADRLEEVFVGCIKALLCQNETLSLELQRVYRSERAHGIAHGMMQLGPRPATGG